MDRDSEYEQALGHTIRQLAQEANESGHGHSLLRVRGLDGQMYRIIMIPPDGIEAIAVGAREP